MSRQSAQHEATFGAVRCNHCGRNINVTQPEVIQFALDDSWPVCCNEIMRFYGADEPTEELPAYQLPPRPSAR
jgi:hypothetical protein